MRSWIRLLIVAAIAASAFTAGWTANGWRLGSEIEAIQSVHIQDKADQLEAFMQRRAVLAAERDALADRMAAIDKSATEKLRKDRNETNRYRDCLSDGTCGLRIQATCAPAAGGASEASNGTGVDPGEGATLDSIARSAYSALRDAIDSTENKLNACQGLLVELTTGAAP
jgi:prophage endopeptidase